MAGPILAKILWLSLLKGPRLWKGKNGFGNSLVGEYSGAGNAVKAGISNFSAI